MRINQLNEERIATLHPKLRPKVAQFLRACEAQDNDILITCGMRTVQQQNELYAQGRTKPGKKVTWVRGGGSYHNYGLAFDIVPLDAMNKAEWDPNNPEWLKAAVIAEQLGFEWGGRWKKNRDLPHFQMTAGYTYKELLAIFQQGGIQAVWAAVDKRLK